MFLIMGQNDWQSSISLIVFFLTPYNFSYDDEITLMYAFRYINVVGRVWRAIQQNSKEQKAETGDSTSDEVSKMHVSVIPVLSRGGVIFVRCW